MWTPMPSSPNNSQIHQTQQLQLNCFDEWHYLNYGKLSINNNRKHYLLNSLDEIRLTLQHANQIRTFEAQRHQSQPWLING